MASRRNDTSSVGRLAEDFATSLLIDRGFSVMDLNAKRVNNPLYDLVAIKGQRNVKVSVKCARAKRELRLGAPHMVETLDDASVVMAFLPAAKGQEIRFETGGKNS